MADLAQGLYRFLDVPELLRPYVRRVGYSNKDYVDFNNQVATAGYIYLGHYFRGTEDAVKVYKGGRLYVSSMPRNQVAGLVTASDMTIACSGIHNQLLFELTATGFFELFHRSGGTTINRALDVADLAPELNDRLNRLPDYGDDTAAMLAHLPGLLEPLIEQRKSAPHFVRQLVARLERNNGMLNLTEAYQKLGYSARHIAKTFAHVVGTRPKQFARSRQFNYVFELLTAGQYDTLTEIAFSAGFVDQPYFIKTLRAFVGAAPKEVLQHPDFTIMKQWLGVEGAPTRDGE